MTDREKVIKGLEIARKLAWNGEHCNIMDDDDALTVSYAITDALALLKAQEPRVMTLKEVKSLEHDAVVWYEYNGANKQHPRVVDQVYDSGIIFSDGGHWQFKADAYGKKFRLWTSRPTDEQREAVKWE